MCTFSGTAESPTHLLRPCGIIYVLLSFSTRVLWSVSGRVRQRPGGSGEAERGHLKGHGQNQRGEWRRLRPSVRLSVCVKPPGVEGTARPLGGGGHLSREAVGGGGSASLHAHSLIEALIK